MLSQDLLGLRRFLADQERIEVLAMAQIAGETESLLRMIPGNSMASVYGSIRSWTGGLLALTDRRLVYGDSLELRKGGVPIVISIDRGTIERAEVEGGRGWGDASRMFTFTVRGDSLAIHASGTTGIFGEIKPVGRGVEFATALNLGVATAALDRSEDPEAPLAG